MNIISVKHNLGEYNIFVGENIINQVNDIISDILKPDRIFVISDTNVYPIYGHNIYSNAHYMIAAGEISKTLDTVRDLYVQLNKANITRKSLIIALGGGVVGDIAGFVASSYLRGVDFIQVPTSLLAQIDSSIGGKTGVDTPFGKNTVGAFYQPKAVISDSAVLSTLPKQYFSDGMGEAIKYGCIYDENLFCSLSNNKYNLNDIIYRCMQIKAEVVEKDEREGNLRMILNFGHTIGHAIEKCENFNGLSHGMAIGIGMLYAAKISEKLGVAQVDVYNPIKKALVSYSLPTDTNINITDLLNAINSDKKRDGDKISWILLDKIGSCVVKKLVTEEIYECFKE